MRSFLCGVVCGCGVNALLSVAVSLTLSVAWLALAALLAGVILEFMPRTLNGGPKR
jgi:hypothetical protein